MTLCRRDATTVLVTMMLSKCRSVLRLRAGAVGGGGVLLGAGPLRFAGRRVLDGCLLGRGVFGGWRFSHLAGGLLQLAEGVFDVEDEIVQVGHQIPLAGETPAEQPGVAEEDDAEAKAVGER